MAKRRNKEAERKQRLVREYVMREEKKGFSLDLIKTRLQDAGYPAADVEAAIKKYNLANIDSRKPMSFEKKPKKNIPAVKMVIALVCIALALVAAVLLMMPSVKDCGDDPVCFIEYANECEPVQLSQTTQGTIFSFSTDVKYSVNSDCTLTKGISTLHESEPQEVRDLFEGKSMVCSYEQGGFNSDWIYTITKGLETCEGELKLAIYEMIIALYEVQ